MVSAARQVAACWLLLLALAMLAALVAGKGESVLRGGLVVAPLAKFRANAFGHPVCSFGTVDVKSNE
jgi:hypothetical protein